LGFDAGIFSVRDGLADYLEVPMKGPGHHRLHGRRFARKFGPGAEGGLAGASSKAAGAPVK